MPVSAAPACLRTRRPSVRPVQLISLDRSDRALGCITPEPAERRQIEVEDRHDHRVADGRWILDCAFRDQLPGMAAHVGPTQRDLAYDGKEFREFTPRLA